MEQIAQVIDRLQALRGVWPRIAKEADVSYSWVCKFAQGNMSNPGIVTLHRLTQALDRAEQRATP